MTGTNTLYFFGGMIAGLVVGLIILLTRGFTI